MLHLLKMDKEKALYGKTGGGSAFHWRKCHGGTGEQNVTGRVVYFPERMKQLIFKNGIVEEGKVYEKGFSYVEMPMGTVHVFLREGYLFPVARGGKCVEDVDFEDLKMYSFGEEIKPYEYYLDDGETKDFALESHIRMLSC